MNDDAGRLSPASGSTPEPSTLPQTSFAGSAANVADLNWPRTAAETRQLRFEATVADAYGIDVAETLCLAWSELHPPSRNYQHCLRLLLHEAVSNALLHGSLEVSGFDRGSLADFKRHSEEITERLAQLDYANRTVAIMMHAHGEATSVTVEDEGRGYELDQLPDPEQLGGLGRGMRLIHDLSESVTVENGGRRIVVVVAANANA